MSYTGGCACGKVTLTVKGEPLTTRQCWCSQCQKLAGGGATHNALFRWADMTLTGDLTEHSYQAASGNTVIQSFCTGCGTPIIAQSSARPAFRVLRFGVLDEPHGLRPEMAIWTQDAPAWATIDPALPQFAQQAPPPPGAS